MPMPKPAGITRLHFQNINGVSLGKGGTWEEICDHYENMEVDIGLACEHKVDTANQSLQHCCTAFHGNF